MCVILLLGLFTLVNVITSEGRPRIYLNGVYKNINKQEKYKRNPYNIIPDIKIIKIIEKETLDFNECFGKAGESREDCLGRLRNPEITRLQEDFNIDSDENLDRTSHYNNFSQDYLDVNDILRTSLNRYVPVKKEKIKKSYIFKVLKPNKYDRFTYDLSKSRRGNRKINYASESGSSESSESISRENENHGKIAKNKRFQIVEKAESDSSQSSEEEKPKPKKKKQKTSNDGMMYMQSPSRLYGLRRRLPNFFPKRYHWTEDDMKDLKNYWFSGPQGRFWGQYKTPYS